MTIQDIYQLAINLGLNADPRPQQEIKKLLKKVKTDYKDLKKDEKREFDKERFTNPYSDTRLLFGNPDKRIKKILAGLEVGVSELLLADKIGKVDLVISHHPLGKALACLDDVMKLQANLLADYGVPINVAENLLEMRMSEVSRKVHPYLHNREIDAARLLKIPLMSIHTPVDNLCYQFISQKISQTKPETVEDLIKILKTIPEYWEATLSGAGPKIFAGKPEHRTGKIAFTEVTGGTAGHKEIYAWFSRAGIGTVVGMHMSEEYREEAEKHHINVVIAGHAASDSLGLNLLLDECEKQGIKVISCAGLIRIARLKSKGK